MTEAERRWLASEDPAQMLEWLRTWEGRSDGFNSRISPRKLRLFAVACARSCWHLLSDPRSRHAVEVAEMFADGVATTEELLLAHREADEATVEATRGSIGEHARADIARVCVLPDRFLPPHVGRWEGLRLDEFGILSNAAQANLLRSICNPFAPPLPRVCPTCGHALKPSIWPERGRLYCDWCSAYPATEPALPCPWITPQVASLAAAAYSSRQRVKCERCNGYRYQPSDRPNWLEKCQLCCGEGANSDGFLDPDACAVLADACEDGGCEDEPLLSHLRGRIWCPSCNGDGEVMLNRIVGKCSACKGAGRLIAAGRVYCRGDAVLDVLLGKS